MNLDDLMAVWKSQDAAPLHGVDKTLLHLALRQEEAKLQRARRRDRWIVYVFSAGLFAGMVIFLVMIFGMLFYNDDDVINGWDVAIPIVGAAAALYMGVYLYVTHRAQAQREQRFGESLRDQLGRRISQLDYAATTAVRQGRALVIASFVGAMAIVIAGIRVNLEPNEPFDLWGSVGRVILMYAILFVISAWATRRSVQRHLLPRKHRLEALLKELEGQ